MLTIIISLKGTPFFLNCDHCVLCAESAYYVDELLYINNALKTSLRTMLISTHM